MARWRAGGAVLVLVLGMGVALLGGQQTARAEGVAKVLHHELTLMVVDPTPEQVTGELTEKQKQQLTDARALRKGRVPPPELLDKWEIKQMSFARREPKAPRSSR